MKIHLATCILVGFGLTGAAAAQESVRDADHPARHSFTKSVSVFAGANQGQSNFSGFNVPQGQVLVIEFVSMECGTAPDDSIRSVRLSVEFPITDQGFIPTSEHFLPVSKQGSLFEGTVQLWVAAQNVRIYAQDHPLGFEHTVTVDFARTNLTHSASCGVTLTGYTVPVQ